MIISLIDYIKFTDGGLKEGDQLIFVNPLTKKEMDFRYSGGIIRPQDGTLKINNNGVEYTVSVSDCRIKIYEKKYNLMKFEIIKCKGPVTLPLDEKNTINTDIGDLIILLNDKNVYLRDWNAGNSDGFAYRRLEVTPEFIRVNIPSLFERIM